jgi:hypothetical protein
MPISPVGATKSMTQYLVDSIDNAKPETSAELAQRLKMPRLTVEGLLYQRSITKGGVYRLHAKWHTGMYDGNLAQANASGITAAEARRAIKQFKKAMPPEIRTAQLRTARPFVELTADSFTRSRIGMAGAPATRPGSEDHKRIPSLYGGQRVPYRGLNSISPTTHDSTVSGLK